MKKLLFSLSVILLMSAGCAVTTATHESPVATSFDGNEQTITSDVPSTPSRSQSDGETTTAPGHTVTLYSIAAEDGNVRLGGFTLDYEDLVVGDDELNWARQAFLSFDISGIPAGATVKSASLDIGHGTKQGYPFALAPAGVGSSARLGLLGVYECQYGTSVSAYDEHCGWTNPLSKEDFTLGFPDGAMMTYSASSLPAGPFSNAALTSAIQARVNAGDSRFQVRLQFEKQSNFNTKMDALVLANPELVVLY